MKQWLYGHETEDRERGMLSKADREFLHTGGRNLNSEQSRRNARRRIRNRIRNAIIDFDLVVRLLSEDDKQLVFEEEGEWWPAFTSGQKSMIEFLYDALDDAEGEDSIDFETILKTGVHDAELERHDGPVFINVEFDVKTDIQFDVESARKRFVQGKGLTIAEIGGLLATGAVEGDEVQELAELAQDKGVVESSISPMQAKYASDNFETFSSGSRIGYPAKLDSLEVPNIKQAFKRGESLMMLDAYSGITPKTKVVGEESDEERDRKEGGDSESAN